MSTSIRPVNLINATAVNVVSRNRLKISFSEKSKAKKTGTPSIAYKFNVLEQVNSVSINTYKANLATAIKNLILSSGNSELERKIGSKTTERDLLDTLGSHILEKQTNKVQLTDNEKTLIKNIYAHLKVARKTHIENKKFGLEVQSECFDLYDRTERSAYDAKGRIGLRSDEGCKRSETAWTSWCKDVLWFELDNYKTKEQLPNIETIYNLEGSEDETAKVDQDRFFDEIDNPAKKDPCSGCPDKDYHYRHF